MNKELPKISIITPSFNQGRFIKETIDSVLSQKYPNLEYFVIDGGSTDNTVEILKSYGDKIRWISEKDDGQANAINKGIRLTDGEIIAFLNSDDTYCEGTLEKVSDFFIKNKREFWLSGDYKIIDENGSELRSFIPKYKNLWKKINPKIALYITNYVAQPSTFWKREVINKVGYFNEDLQYTMDYEFWLRLLKDYKLNFIYKKLSNFRIHNQSKGESRRIDQFNEEIVVLEQQQVGQKYIQIHRFSNALIKSIYFLIN